MTKLLQEALAVLRQLPAEEQNRAARAMLAFTRGLNDDAQELAAS